MRSPRSLRQAVGLAGAVAVLLLIAASALAQETRVVTGTVTDSETGNPIGFAQVSVVGTARGAVADQDGNFRLEGAPAGPFTLRVQSLGYRTLNITVAPDRSVVEVALLTDYLNVDEIVVTGRATEISKRNAANAISVVTAREIDRVPAQSIEQQLQGKVAGADIQKNSGAPGGGIQVNLRGVSSINAASEPLYVVDGVIVSNVAIPNGQDVVTQASGGSNPSALQQDQVNRIADLNPNDIERIEILKGASASAIYGSKASNGVVLISTKQGRPGPPRVDVTQRFGVFDLSETIGYRSFQELDVEEVVEIFGEDARAPFLSGQVFDFEKDLFGRNDLSTETIVSISGGDENTRYYASGLIKNDEGIVPRTGFEAQSIRLNLSHVQERWDIGIHTNLLHTETGRGLFNNDNISISPFFAFAGTPRFIDLRQRADGSFPDNPFGASNPFQTFALMKNEEDVWRFLTSVDATLGLYRGETSNLDLVLVGGADWFNQKNDLFFPPELFFEPDDGLPGTSLETNGDNLNLNGSVNLVHSRLFGAGTARTSAGFQFESRDLAISRIVAQNLIAGQENLGSGTQIQVAERREEVEDFGFYVQEELLLLDERLALTGAIRGEQSSSNGDPDDIFWYPKVSASYRIPQAGSGIDELKLRVAYGESGNQPLFGQKFISLDATGNIGGEPGLVVSPEVGDPDIEPERTSEIEAGADLLLFGGAAQLEATFYQQNITELILERTVAPSTGFGTQFFNGGELRIRGFEAGFAVTPIQTEDFLWISRTTFAIDRSEVIELPVPSFVIGGAFGTDLGDFVIEEGESATQIVGPIDGELGKVGDVNPDFKFSFVNDATWGPWNFYVLWDWQEGGDIINLDTLISDLSQTTIDFVGNGAERLSSIGVNAPYVEDGSFVKLRELTVSYDVPTSVVKQLWGGFERVRLSASGRDLLTFTDYSGLDPEVSNFGNQPIARNVATSPFPPSRSFWFSVDLGF